MNRRKATRAAKAFTVLELLVVIVIVGVVFFVAVTPPGDRAYDKAKTVACMSHLRQIGIGMMVWAEDRQDRFPAEVSITNGGSFELIGLGRPALHFQQITNTVTQPNTWTCPTDKARWAARSTNAAFADSNLSYFVSVDAKLTNGAIILAGDRHLEVSGRAVAPGLFALATNTRVSWTRESHPRPGEVRYGNLLFTDGHAERVQGRHFTDGAARQGLATNRLAVP